MKKAIPYMAAIILILFGGLTLFMSSSVLFDLFGIRAKQGNYVPFIVWTNFICAFIYLTAAYGFWKGKNWTRYLLGAALVLLILAYVGLKIHIANGGLYELKTVSAMKFRIAVTAFFTTVAVFSTSKGLRKGEHHTTVP